MIDCCKSINHIWFGQFSDLFRSWIRAGKEEWSDERNRFERYVRKNGNIWIPVGQEVKYAWVVETEWNNDESLSNKITFFTLFCLGARKESNEKNGKIMHDQAEYFTIQQYKVSLGIHFFLQKENNWQFA